jgi:hypothetical protein
MRIFAPDDTDLGIGLASREIWSRDCASSRVYIYVRPAFFQAPRSEKLFAHVRSRVRPFVVEPNESLIEGSS